MKKFVIIIWGFLLIGVSLSAGVANKDRPSRGKWDFEKEEIFRITEAGSEVIANIGHMATDESENLYLLDRKRVKVYRFDRDGTFISAFGKKGEGPGEIRNPRGMDLREEDLIIFDSGKVHYYTTSGKFIQSFIIPREIRPRLMLDRFTLLSLPYINWRDPRGIGQILLYDLKTRQQRVLMEFATYKKGVVRKSTSEGSHSFSLSHYALTPLMILTVHEEKIYYGMNNSYQITVADLNMKELLRFGIDRKKTTVPAAFKDEVVEGVDFPDSIKKEIKRGFPSHFTYFSRIIIDKNDRIYTVLTDPLQENRVKLDIFSPDGQYIYSAEIEVDEDSSIQRSYLNGDKLYLGLEDGEGDLVIVKYKLLFPPL